MKTNAETYVRNQVRVTIFMVVAWIVAKLILLAWGVHSPPAHVPAAWGALWLAGVASLWVTTERAWSRKKPEGDGEK